MHLAKESSCLLRETEYKIQAALQSKFKKARVELSTATAAPVPRAASSKASTQTELLLSKRRVDCETQTPVPELKGAEETPAAPVVTATVQPPEGTALLLSRGHCYCWRRKFSLCPLGHMMFSERATVETLSLGSS